MSALRYISMILIFTLTIESSILSIWANPDEAIVNSIEDLEIEASIVANADTATISGGEKTIETDITQLIAAKIEYKNTEIPVKIEPIFITDPFQKNIENAVPVETTELFENFVKNADSPLLIGEKKEKIKVDYTTQKSVKIRGSRGSVGVKMIEGTTISSKDGTIIDPATIDIATISGGVIQKALEHKQKTKKKIKNKDRKKQAATENIPTEENPDIGDVFEFGIPGKHLIFSSPVAITIETPNYSDGNAIDIAVLHEGDSSFNTNGLSVRGNSLCNEDGSSSIPGSTAIVKNGKITFYTCGASSFTMNPSGGTTGSNDLRLIIGDCAQTQIYYNNQPQIYTGNPPATGCAATNGNMDAWPVLRIGTVSYGNDFSAWSTSTTTGSTVGNTYTAKSTMTRVVGGRTYTLIIDWEHTAPNKYITWSYRVIIPAGNTLNVRFYYGMDSFVAGADTNDVGYYTSTGGQTVGIYDGVANIVSAFRYVNGPAWSGYQANAWNTVRTQIANGADFTNNIQATGGDLGFGINWNFGTAPATYTGSVEWRLLPYVAANVPDLIPGIAQPEGPLTTGFLSQLPINITNAGNLSSSGIHTVVLTLPATISGPAAAFTDNGWSCGAQVGATVTCTKTTNIASLGTDTVRIPVIPLPAAGGTSVTFNVAISNPGDSNTTNNTAFATNAVVTGTLSYAPGGVTGMTLWLKGNGNKNCSTAGCTITTWSNSGTLGVGANAVTGLGTVTYDPTNTINYNPTLYFNNASLNTNSNLSITTAAASVFTMTKLQTGGIFRIGPQTAVNNSLDWSTLPTIDRVARYNGTVIYNGSNQRGLATPDITTTIRAAGGTSTNYTNGSQTLTNAAVTTGFVGTNIGIGRTVNTNSTLASVGEVIVYPSQLTLANKNKVESYLAIKYGNTLNQLSPQNYVFSNGTVVWDSTIGGAYNKDIAGIGRDDISALNQAKSQSVNSTNDIIVSSINPITINYRALVWANNGTNATTLTTTDSPGNSQRIAREWQIQERNGDIGNIKVAYPNAALPVGMSTPIYMMVDSDGIFASGATAYTGTLVGPNWEFTANITDQQYISFAQFGETIPPTISSISRASGSLMPIGNFPLVVNYSDTGSLINPASFTGKIYPWDGVSTWSGTNIAPSYMTVTAANTSSGGLQINNLPFGKYRFDISISDNDGNITTQSYIYYVDAIEWSVSSAEYDMGNIIPNTTIFGSGFLTVTVKTVGAGFSLKMAGANTLASGPDTINYWDGLEGWGYDSGGSILGNHSSGVTVVTQSSNINTNGQKNTYTYNLRYGANLSANMIAGLYNGSIKLDLVLNY